MTTKRVRRPKGPKAIARIDTNLLFFPLTDLTNLTDNASFHSRFASGMCLRERSEGSRAGTLQETFARCFTAFNMTLLWEDKSSAVASNAIIPRCRRNRR